MTCLAHYPSPVAESDPRALLAKFWRRGRPRDDAYTPAELMEAVRADIDRLEQEAARLRAWLYREQLLAEQKEQGV